MSKRMTIIFALGLLVTISTVYAQGITGGLKAGMNIANLHGDDVGGLFESKMGFCAGGFITFKVANIVAIQPEVLCTQKGAKWEIVGGTWKDTYNLNYLEIPVLLKVIMPIQGMIKPHLFVGPYFAYNLTAKTKTEHNGHNGYSEEIDVDEEVKDGDFGAVFGGGIDFGLPAGKIVFDARYSLGLTAIYKEVFDVDVKNNVFSFMLGYAF